MKNLIDFKNIHKGKDIYVIGSGKSCDFIDPTFFDNKITIGINEVYTRFKTTYLCRKELVYISQSVQNTNSIVFCSSGECGGLNGKNLKLAKRIQKEKRKNSDKIVIFDHRRNHAKAGINIKRDLPELNENKILVSYSTSCSAIHLALYMGAKNIILVGLDGGKIDGEINYKGYVLDSYKTAWGDKGEGGYKKWIKSSCINNDMITLKTHFKKKYNCNVYSLNPFVNFRLDGHKFEL